MSPLDRRAFLKAAGAGVGTLLYVACTRAVEPASEFLDDVRG